MVRSILYFLIILLFGVGCLKKQNWTIEEPQWPRYKLEGWIFSSDVGPIKNTMLVLIPMIFLFPDTMPPETTYTDSTGFFSFGEVPALQGYIRVYYDTSIYGIRVVIQHDRRDTFYINITPSLKSFAPLQKRYKIPFLKTRNQF